MNKFNYVYRNKVVLYTVESHYSEAQRGPKLVPYIYQIFIILNVYNSIQLLLGLAKYFTIY